MNSSGSASVSLEREHWTMRSARVVSKTDRIVIRLEPEARVLLHEAADYLGLDDATYARMLILQKIKGAPRDHERDVAEPRWHADAVGPERVVAPITDPARAARPHSGALPLVDDVDAEPLPVEEMDIPADEDDDPDGVAAAAVNDLLAIPMMQALEPKSYRLAPRPAGPTYGPGSKTRAVGVNYDAVGANQYGDGPNNVRRDNMRHFLAQQGPRRR
jgi:hypothetical protein